ncbi:hypothetical protein EV44_g3701 [Erysiphe necator]|uniref:Uncharacterized protein n=1 Tax=Uncinula necator TaxID=52586 RepID=A0A0B1P8L4_UNCNE|nr:hypothetical protein EV44_g3701 [Erysiphe necator]
MEYSLKTSFSLPEMTEHKMAKNKKDKTVVKSEGGADLTDAVKSRLELMNPYLQNIEKDHQDCLVQCAVKELTLAHAAHAAHAAQIAQRIIMPSPSEQR